MKLKDHNRLERMKKMIGLMKNELNRKITKKIVA